MIPRLIRATSPVISIVAALLLLPGLALSAPIPEIAPEIVSAWKSSTSDTLLIFRHDGVYFQVQDDATRPGMERGTFTWNQAASAFSATTLRDTNGESGLSHPAGATTLSISGNTLTYTVAGQVPFLFSRVTNTASAIVGSWFIPGERVTLTFLADGTYYHSQESNEAPDGYDGMERGTFTWDSFSGVLTAVPITDTNGWSGLSDQAPDVTVSVAGNVMTMHDGEETYTGQRITTNPTPFRLPDFGVVQFANYLQISNSTPALRDFNTLNESYPYSADAFVDPVVAATAPEVKIGNGASITMTEEDPGSFEIESGFASLSALNTYLPNSTAVQFKNGTATATLTTAASQTFPSIPKIIVREGASWSGSVYNFGDDEVLQWTLPTGFVASQYFTILEVYDPNADFDAVVAEFQGEVTHFDLAGKLEPGKEYSVEIEFYRIDSSTTTGAAIFAGKQGSLVSASSTLLQIESLPDTAQQPSIIQQPVSQTSSSGSPLFLTVGINEAAFSTSTFQWFKNGAAIPGQTGNSLTLGNFQSGDVASYTVTCSNPAGSVTSQPATLILPTTVPGPQTIGFAAIPDQLSTIHAQLPAVSAGEAHSLFLKSDGSVWATGKNVNGQLGNGSLYNQSTPVPVFTGVAAISAYYQHSLLLKADGTAWACGWNQSGQLGYLDLYGTQEQPILTQVLDAVTRISAGERHSLFVKSDGTAWATGGNANGQLGTGDTVNRTSPVQVLSGVADVAAGYSHSLFLKTDGSVWAAGANYDGQLGNGTTTAQNSPIQVMSGVAAVSAGEDFSLFLKTDGTVWATGYNSNGQLGTGDLASRSTPVQILSGVTSIEAGYFHSLFVKADGTAWAAGDNSGGQLATGSAGDATVPIQVMTGVQAVNAGGGHSLFLKTDGSIRVAGDNYFGQFGVASPASTTDSLQVFQAKAPTLITLAATSTSGLPITYTILSGPATLDGSTLTVTGVGTIVVRASQSGNALFTAATPVNVTFHAVESDPFLSFVASLPSDRRAAADDFDNDGISNLLEYLLGGNPTLPSSGLLPTITKAPSSNNLVFTYKRKIAATGVTQVIEHATILSVPWTAAVHGQNGVTITTSPVPGDATAEQVTVTIPSTSTSRFVRLKATR